MNSADIQSQAQQRLEHYRKQRKQFVELIKRQEVLARENPNGYRRKVVAYAWLGYLYVLGIMLLLALLVVGSVLIAVIAPGGALVIAKFGILLVPVIAVVAKALFVKIEPPHGERVTRQQAPALWQEVDSLTQELKAPKIHEIVIDMDSNAAAAQRPTLGMFGRYRNSLILGLPLLVTLTKDEMQAIIAHEFGHFSGQHGRVSGWVYRLNETYARIRAELSNHGSAAFFRSFYNWFQPRFDAVSFVLRRQNEYEADAAAARISGNKAMGRMLMRLPYIYPAVKAGLWNRLEELAHSEPLPPENAFGDLQADIAKGLESVDVRERLERRLAEKTDYEDTHPCLTDRLRAIGELPTDLDRAAEDLRRPIAKTAAEEYFGSFLPELTKRIGAEYAKDVAPGWKNAYQHHKESIEELARLEGIDDKPLTVDERIDLAFLTLRKREAKDAVPMFERLVEEHPDNAQALYGLGEAKLALDDESGEHYLRESMRLNMSYLRPAMNLIGSFRARTGRDDQMEDLREEFIQRSHVAESIERERRTYRVWDTFSESMLTADQRDSIMQQLKARKDVKEAYLISKIVPIEGAEPTNLLLIFTTRAMLSRSDRNKRILDDIIKTVKFPGHVMLYIPASKDHQAWRKRMTQIPNSRLV